MGGKGSDGQTHRRTEAPNQGAARERGLPAMETEGLFHRTIRARDGEAGTSHHDAGDGADDRPLAQRGPPAGMHGVLGILVGGDGVQRLGTGKPEDEGIGRHPDHDTFDPPVQLTGLSHGPNSDSPSYGHQGVGLSRERGCRTAEDRQDENPSHEGFRRGGRV